MNRILYPFIVLVLCAANARSQQAHELSPPQDLPPAIKPAQIAGHPVVIRAGSSSIFVQRTPVPFLRQQSAIHVQSRHYVEDVLPSPALAPWDFMPYGVLVPGVNGIPDAGRPKPHRSRTHRGPWQGENRTMGNSPIAPRYSGQNGFSNGTRSDFRGFPVHGNAVIGNQGVVRPRGGSGATPLRVVP